MKGILILIAALLGGGLAGCVSLPYDPSKMSADQLHEVVKDRNVLGGCTTVMGPGYSGKIVQVQLDATAIASGTVTVTDQCAVTVSAEPKVPAPPKATQALCDDMGQAFMLVGSALLRTPAEDSRCARPMAMRLDVQPSPSEAAAARLEQDRARRPSKRSSTREDE